MKNIFDYLDFYKDISFKEFVFNEVDALILGVLSYVKFDDIVPRGIKEYIYLEDAVTYFLERYCEDDFKKENWLFPNSYKLMTLLGRSKRFYHTKLYHYNPSVGEKGQFGALTIRLTNGITYVSYEGTDSNVIGWKEDFELIYKNPIYSQEMARDYFNETINFWDRKIIVGGHSKGGNLAMYAYMYGNEKLKKRVKKVYNYDGPGFLSTVYESEKYAQMSTKLEWIVPKDSVIGVILGNGTYTVVNSSGYGVLSHDAYTWECFGGQLVKTELSKKSRKLETNLKAYIDDMSIEERKNFVETFFAVFSQAGITNIMQLKDFKISTLLQLVKNLTSVPAATKRNLIAVLRMLITGMN